MPHQCTNCGRGFADGSKEMLSGCPNCGGTKFQFQPGAGGGAQSVQTELPTDSWRDSLTASTESTEAASTTSTASSDNSITFSESDSSTGHNSVDDDDVPAEAVPENNEDNAQAKARGDMIRQDELPSGQTPPNPESSSTPESEVQPDLSELREELNNQFESIKVVEPGQYELNLMELFDREEYIIELQENGHYAIEVPDAWEDLE